MATKKRGTRKGAGGSGRDTTEPKARKVGKVDEKPRVSAKKQALLDALGHSPFHITRACESSGVSRTAYYKWLTEEWFASEVQRRRDALIDRLEDNTLTRAVDGWEEPVFYQGEECGAVRKFDNGLSWKMLAKHRPDLYREVKQDDAKPFDVGIVPMETMAHCRENASRIAMAMSKGDLPVAQGRELLAAVKEARETIAGEDFEKRLAALEDRS